MGRINGLLVAGIACLSLGQAWAQQDDGVPRVTDPSIPLSYVGNNGSIAIGVNSEGESEGRLTGMFARNDERAFIEQLRCRRYPIRLQLALGNDRAGGP